MRLNSRKVLITVLTAINLLGAAVCYLAASGGFSGAPGQSTHSGVDDGQ